jgi:tubulin delta
MSIVTIQLGQCGNQVGYDLFSTLVQDCQLTSKTQGWPADSYSNACLDMFFTTTSDKTAVPRAKAVLVDMESKVISKVTANATKSRQWCYDSSRSVCRSSGSGNNWAAGFYVNGPSMAEPVLEAVRKEVEACDHFEGFIALLSLAGGTGSGVGTYITQCLRDHYPNCMLLGQVVWPYENGEVIVQNYNSLLTLSNLYRNADIILAMDNDTLHRICFQRLAISKVSFSDMNRILGHKLASILQPVYSDSGSSKFIRNHLGLFVVQCT